MNQISSKGRLWFFFSVRFLVELKKKLYLSPKGLNILLLLCKTTTKHFVVIFNVLLRKIPKVLEQKSQYKVFYSLTLQNVLILL
jgi:hypothetical protein